MNYCIFYIGEPQIFQMSSEELWDAIVVGAGVVGSWAAYHLADSGRKVLLLDQFNLPHYRGSSHGHSRLIRQMESQDLWPPLKTECYHLWRKLEKDTGYDLMTINGLLRVERGDHQYMVNCMKVMRKYNLDFQYLDNKMLREKYPMLDYPEDVHGLFDPQGGILVPDKCQVALREMITRKGGVIRDLEKVENIHPGEIVKVETSNNVYLTKSVILTPGPWAGDLLSKVGLKVPLKTMPGWPTYWQTDGTRDYRVSKGMPTVIEQMKVDDGYRFVIFCPEHEYPGMVKIASRGQPPPSYQHPDRRDQDDKKSILKFLSGYIRDNFKGVIPIPAIEEPCMYTMTPDRKFIIDRHPVYKNIIIGAGFSGTGYKLAPVAGKLLYQIAVGNPTSYDVSEFRITRFGNICSSKL